jgi:hypothetical protein
MYDGLHDTTKPNRSEEYLEMVRSDKTKSPKVRSTTLEELSNAYDILEADVNELHELEIGNTLVEHGEEMMKVSRDVDDNRRSIDGLKIRVMALETVIREFRVLLNNSMLAR